MKFENQTRLRKPVLIALTVAAGAVFLSIDLGRTGSSVTPLLALCWMLAFSMRLGPRLLFQIAAILAVFVAASLWGQAWDRVIIRCLSYLVGASVALMHARARIRGERLIEQLKLMVERAPSELVVADRMGSILSASDELKRLLAWESEDLEGQSFPDILMGKTPPGDAMRKFIEWFRRDGVHDELLCFRREPRLCFRARITSAGVGADRMLIATLDDSYETEDKPAS